VRGQARAKAKRGHKMDTVQKCKMVLVVVATGVMIWFAVLAVQFGNKISKQTEQNFADAVRVMQGTK